MFNITMGKGFQMTFANGWTVSIQFGPGNYCGHYSNFSDFDAPRRKEFWKSELAEIAAWDATKKWYDFGSDTVKGYVNANEVSDFIAKIAAL